MVEGATKADHFRPLKGVGHVLRCASDGRRLEEDRGDNCPGSVLLHLWDRDGLSAAAVPLFLDSGV